MAIKIDKDMKHVTIFFLSVLPLVLCSQSTDSPIGRWKTLDEDTGEPRSIVEIYAKGNTFEGKIVEILDGDENALCEKCKGEKKNAPIKGMVIITGLTASSDYWKKGTVLDPENGSTYRFSVWYEDNDANRLFVRGKHWTGIYRTQTWVRE